MWTSEREETVKQRWLSGERASSIAADYGLSKNSIIAKMQRMGVPCPYDFKHWTKDEESEVAKLWMEGWSATLIAQRVKRSRNAIIGKIVRLRLLRRSRPTFVLRPPKRAAQPIPVISISANHKFRAVPLLELRPGECRYPLGDGPFLFCGQPAIAGESYCPHCWQITHAPRPNHPTKYTFEDAA